MIDLKHTVVTQSKNKLLVYLPGKSNLFQYTWHLKLYNIIIIFLIFHIARPGILQNKTKLLNNI